MSSPPKKTTLVLASGSPRRREILESLGFTIRVRPVDIDETPLPGEKPNSYVLRLARDKAAARGEPGEVVLGADTIVVEDGEILGKPVDAEDAQRMLRRLSGKTHEVLTGVALHDVGTKLQVAFVSTTEVVFKTLDDAEVDWYVATGEPLDKAGAYGIQGRAALFVEAIRGDYSNVVGLPVAALYRLLRQAGYALPNLPRVAPDSPDAV